MMQVIRCDDAGDKTRDDAGDKTMMQLMQVIDAMMQVIDTMMQVIRRDDAGDKMRCW